MQVGKAMQGMGKKRFIAAVAMLALALVSLFGCGEKEEAFTFSSGLTKDGYWDLKAGDYVELCPYEGIDIPQSVHTVSEAELEAAMMDYAMPYAPIETIRDRAVADGDTVNIDYVGSIDGVPFDGGSTGGEGAEVTIGVTSYIDDFLEQLIGHLPGETFDVRVTFPQDYQAEGSGDTSLNGKDAVFVTTVNFILEEKEPTLDDAFVAEHLSQQYGWQTVASMREELAASMEEEAILFFLQEHIMDHCRVSELPPQLMDYQEKAMLRQFADNAAQYGMTPEDLYPMYGVEDEADFLDMMRQSNEQNATFSLIIQALAEDLDLRAGDSEIRDYYDRYNMSEAYAQHEEYFGKPYIKRMVMTQQIMDYLKEKSRLETGDQ